MGEKQEVLCDSFLETNLMMQNVKTEPRAAFLNEKPQGKEHIQRKDKPTQIC